MATIRLKDGERCEGCERVLASLDGDSSESLHEWYDGGNHVCPLGCPSCQEVVAWCTDEASRELLMRRVTNGTHIHERPRCQCVEAAGSIIAAARRIGELGEKKNAAYGDSVAKYEAFLRLLWPNGIPATAYRDAGLATRLFDKLMRIATANDPDGENPWDDIAGYSLIAAAEGK